MFVENNFDPEFVSIYYEKPNVFRCLKDLHVYQKCVEDHYANKNQKNT